MKTKFPPCEINPKTRLTHRCNRDRYVEAYDITNGYQLHRFLNCFGDGYSAIYDKDGYEIFSCVQRFEYQMLEAFERKQNQEVMK